MLNSAGFFPLISIARSFNFRLLHIGVSPFSWCGRQWVWALCYSSRVDQIKLKHTGHTTSSNPIKSSQCIYRQKIARPNRFAVFPLSLGIACSSMRIFVRWHSLLKLKRSLSVSLALSWGQCKWFCENMNTNKIPFGKTFLIKPNGIRAISKLMFVATLLQPNVVVVVIVQCCM